MSDLRERSTELIVNSEALLRGILAISSEAIITVGPDFRIDAFSSGAESLLSYSAQEVVGQPLEMLMPARYRGGHGRLVAAFREPNGI